MNLSNLMCHASVVAMLDHTVAEYGSRSALVYEDKTINYREMRRCVAGLVQALAGLSPKSHRIATLMGNSIAAALVPFAIAGYGATHIPMNPLYTTRELEYMLLDAQPSIVVVDDVLLPKITALLGQIPNCVLLATSEVLAYVPQWVDDTGLDLITFNQPDSAAIALLQYTGGSTGRPKGVQLSHRAVNANIAQREALLPVARGCESVLCVMPLFHSYAMAMGLYLSVYSGSTLVILHAYHPERVLDAINQQGITIFPGSPTIFVGLMNFERFRESDWSRVHTCYSGSAALAADTLEKWENSTGSIIFEGYGQTEAGPILTYNPAQGRRKTASVGIALPETEVEIVDTDTGTTVLSSGFCGEIRARGPQIMSGYWNLPNETQDSLREGWLYTGDIGEFDTEGYLYIRDRKKDFIIVGGYNVYPREIEEVLYSHPAVGEAAVIGVADNYRGEVLRAYVALQPLSNVSSDELLDYCRVQLAKYKVPVSIEILPELPKTSVNKIDKKPLRERLA